MAYLIMKPISASEVEKRLRAWADITMLSIELKHAMLRNKYPDLGEDELRDLIRKEYSAVKDSSN